MVQDGGQIREKIISFIRLRGPSLPVQIAKETNLSILFASAFLSELFGDKTLKMSYLRVGSSPLYFIPGQEPQLERFSQYLKSKEKDAFVLLKEDKILVDAEQQPAIRVALREIKDFAVPFEKNNQIFWRYFLVEEPSVVEEIEQVVPKKEVIKEIISESEEAEIITEIEEVQREDIKIDKQEREAPKKEKQKKPKSEAKPKKPIKNDKKNENFFNKIKEFLAKKKVEILDIKDFKNDEAVLKVKKGNNEELLFVFNKKTIAEKEILKAWKKASDLKMPYSILSLGETSKKISEMISAFKGISNIDKLE